MIRSGENKFTPGSIIPKNAVDVDLSENFLLEEYLLSAGWEQGIGLLILGNAGSGKTSTGLTVIKHIRKIFHSEMIYWTEHDFLSDLRNLWRMEEMTQKYSRDDALWDEYTEWERDFWDLKEAPFLFLDDVCRGYSPMHTYEVENLLRLRENKQLTTFVAAQIGLWENAPTGLTSVVERNSMVIRTSGSF